MKEGEETLRSLRCGYEVKMGLVDPMLLFLELVSMLL